MLKTNAVPFRCMKDLCGKYLGSGAAREVYAYRPDPTLVIKLETHRYSDAYSYQNVNEYTTWSRLPTRYRKWLAPCVAISDDGRVLLQRRAERVRSNQLPTRFPAWLGWDLKRRNWGLYRGKPVLVDYGCTDLIAFAMANQDAHAWQGWEWGPEDE